MTTPLKRLLRAVLPAPLAAALVRRRRLRFSGPYPSWAAARTASRGYDDDAILTRMVEATRAVAAGRAAFERDTVLFTGPQHDPLLAAELAALASRRPAPLRVLDFGGALGSTWWQHRALFATLPPIEWHVVEQPAVAARGRAEFARPGLAFHDSLASALPAGPPDLVLAASVLQYLESPWTTLAELAALPAATWLVARTPFVDAAAADLLTVQHVPANIYRASYPAWVFPAKSFAAFATARGLAIEWHACDDGAFTAGGVPFDFRTVILRRAPAQETASPRDATP